MNRTKQLAVSTALVSSLVVPDMAAMAQSIALEEIVVTARKREESLMQAPLAITAMSADTLEAMNLTTMEEVATFAPGFHYVTQTGGGSGRADRSASSLVFRGLFLGTSNAGQTAGGLVFIDGSPVIGGQPPALVDMERVEVLKGPQSAYFGRSVLAGAINYVTRDPSADEFKGRVTASYANYDTVLFQGSLEGPITDSLAVRLSASHDSKGGQYTNAADAGQKLGKRETNSIALQATFAPSDNLSVKGFFNYLEHNDGPPAQAALKGSQGDFNCNAPIRIFGYFCGQIPDVDDLEPSIISGNYELGDEAFPILVGNSTNQPVIYDPSFLDHPGLRRVAVNTHLRVDYETDTGYSFSSLTAYHYDKDMSIIDLNFRDFRNVPNSPPFSFFPGAPAFNRWQLAVQGKFQDYSQEFRVSSPQDQSLRWSLGGNYLKTKSPGGSVYGLSVIGPGFFSAITALESETPSVFGGIQYDITDDLTLSVDARYQWDKLSQTPVIGSDGQPTGAATLEETFTSFSPRVSLDYKYADDSTIYLLFSRGFRPGGFNALLASSTPEVIAQFAQFNAGLAFDEERLDNYELGVKSTWLDGRAQTRLAIYYDPYRNGQNGITIPFTNPDGSLNLATVTVNTGRADLKGFEFEADLAVTDGLTMSGTLGYADTEVKEFFCGDGINVNDSPDCNGNTLPSASKWTWTLSADYSASLTGDYDWYTRVDYSHLGKYFVDYSNAAWGGPQDIVNARIGVRTDEMSLEGFVTNLFDESAPPSAVIGNDLVTFASSNEIRYTLARKRQWGVRATFNF